MGEKKEKNLVQRELQGLTIEAWVLSDRAKSGPPIRTTDLDRFLGQLQRRMEVIRPLIKK
jgi:hypothetical protein